MMHRRGSTALATVLSVAGLLVAGVGGYAAYHALNGGGCGSCHRHEAATRLVSDESGQAAEMPPCCAGHTEAGDKPAGECPMAKKSCCHGEPGEGEAHQNDAQNDDAEQPSAPAAEPASEPSVDAGDEAEPAAGHVNG